MNTLFAYQNKGECRVGRRDARDSGWIAGLTPLRGCPVEQVILGEGAQHAGPQDAARHQIVATGEAANG